MLICKSDHRPSGWFGRGGGGGGLGAGCHCLLWFCVVFWFFLLCAALSRPRLLSVRSRHECLLYLAGMATM